jgi:hypothetical protein
VERFVQFDAHSFVRSGFISHSDEDESDRIASIQVEAEKQLQWILQKVFVALN